MCGRKVQTAAETVGESKLALHHRVDLRLTMKQLATTISYITYVSMSQIPQIQTA